jgi:hypothetical protein
LIGKVYMTRSFLLKCREKQQNVFDKNIGGMRISRVVTVTVDYIENVFTLGDWWFFFTFHINQTRFGIYWLCLNFRSKGSDRFTLMIIYSNIPNTYFFLKSIISYLLFFSVMNENKKKYLLFELIFLYFLCWALNILYIYSYILYKKLIFFQCSVSRIINTW